MIVEHLSVVVSTCDRCRTPETPCHVLNLHESDQGQHVYNIRLNLTVRVCFACIEKNRTKEIPS